MSVSKGLRRRKYSCTNFRLHQTIHSCRHDVHQKSRCCIVCPATRMGSRELIGVEKKRLSNCIMWGRKGHFNLHCNKNASVIEYFSGGSYQQLRSFFHFFTPLLQNRGAAHLFLFVLSESQPSKNSKLKTWQVLVNRQNYQSNNTGNVAFRSSSLHRS